jgi:hypothetical protein
MHMHHNAGFHLHPEDLPNQILGYNPTSHLNEEQQPTQPETEVTELKMKRWKLKPRARPLSLPKSL